MKNRYVGRTFIQPSQALRERGVKLKLNPMPDSVRGKRLVVIDDSIVRGTTTRQIVQALREAGATEVHTRITCPPIRWPCFYGIDMSTRQELIAADLAVDQIRDYVGRGFARVPVARGDGGRHRPGPRFVLSRVLRRRVPDPDPRARGQVPARTPREVVSSEAYRRAGVDLDAAARAVELIRDLGGGASRPELVEGVGGFAGLFEIGDGRFLAAATDGVGTKLEIARRAGRLDTVGIDLVAMCADDVVCTGAEPLFFLDYLAVGSVEPERVRRDRRGVAEGCRRAGCALLGGETAEHPGVMAPDAFDLAGFCVGVVEQERRLGPDLVQDGDVLIGLASSGLHANGFSLVRTRCWSVAATRSTGSSRRSAGRWSTSCSNPRRSTPPLVLGLGRERACCTPRRTSRAAGSSRTSHGSLPRGLEADVAWGRGPNLRCSSCCAPRPGRPEDDLRATFNLGDRDGARPSRPTGPTR